MMTGTSKELWEKMGQLEDLLMEQQHDKLLPIEESVKKHE